MNQDIKPPIFMKKCLHPKVLKILEKFSPPSPMLMPRDKSQPKTGQIRSLASKYSLNIQPRKTFIKEKPQLALNLDSTLLKRRKYSSN